MNANRRLLIVGFVISAILLPPRSLPRALAFQVTGERAAEATLVSLGRIGGDIRTVAVEGEYAFTAEGSELSVIDISNPENPTRVAGLPIPWTGRDLAILNDEAYLAGEGGLLIFDIQDPLNPDLLGSYATSAQASNISVSGDLVFLALGEDGLLILNASNPSQPVEAGSYPGVVNDVWASGDQAYLAGEDLRILEVSDPANPALLGTYDGGKPFQVVQAAGSLVYLAAGSNYLIVDAADPSAPDLLVDEYLAFQIHDVRVLGDNIYFLAVELNILNLSNDCLAGVLDVSDLSNPGLLGSITEQFSTSESCAGRLFPSGERLFVAHGQLQLIDSSDPGQLELSGTYTTLRPSGVAVEGSNVYVADETQGLVIFGTGEPFSLTRRGSLGLKGWATGVRLAGRYAFVWTVNPSHPHFPSGSLNIVDVGDPDHPVLLSSQSVTYVHDLSVTGETLYLVDGRPGFSSHLEILDISNPSSPNLLGEYGSTEENAETVFALGDTIYLIVSDYPGGENQEMRILDASDPTNILILSSLPVIYTYGLIVQGDLAFTALGEEGLLIMDVSDPAHPADLSGIIPSGGVWDVRIQGNHAFLAAGSEGVLVIDVSDPLNPVQVASGETFEPAWQIAASRDLVFSQGSEAGVEILRWVTRTVAEVGSGGGTLESTGDRTAYDLPAGVFPETVTVVHDTRFQFGLPDIGKKMGIQHAFENRAISEGGEPIQPLAPYSLTIRYSQAEEGPAIEGTLALYYWDGEEWLPEPSAETNTAANRITASPDHFGLFAVLGETHRLYFPFMGGR
jgi:hypothetical protein